RIEGLHEVRHGAGTEEHVGWETVVLDDEVCSLFDVGFLEGAAFEVDDHRSVDQRIETVPLLRLAVKCEAGVTCEQVTLDLLEQPKNTVLVLDCNEVAVRWVHESCLVGHFTSGTKELDKLRTTYVAGVSCLRKFTFLHERRRVSAVISQLVVLFNSRVR